MTPNSLLSTRPALSPLLSRAAQAWRGLWHASRALALTVAVSAALIALALIGLAADPRTITGVPAWMKPLKFAISVGVYAATLAWMLTFVRGRRRLVALAGGATALAFLVELALIVVQVLRGTTSHFNLSTAFDAALYSTMGFMIMLVWAMNVLVALVLLRQRDDGLEPGLAWSLRLGLLLSAVGMGVAFLMTSLPTPAQAEALTAGQTLSHFGAHSVGVEDGGPGLPLVGWSTEGGDLRVAHFVGLHGLQVLPLLALALPRAARLSAGQRRGLVWVAALGYLGLTALTTWQALRGQSVIAPDALTLAAAGTLLGAVALGAWWIVRRGDKRAAPVRSAPRRLSRRARLGRLLLGVLAALVVLAITGMVYESTARARALRGVAAPGLLVPVGEHNLHLVCQGEKVAGQPTVILEAGVGGWSSHWHAVQPAVAGFTRVCAYDRAGYGWSEAGPGPRDGQVIAAELHALLERAGESGPYVLVGASRGGQYVRLYQAAYPAEVAGLVLVDGEPENFAERSEMARNAASQNQAIFSVMGALSRVGVLRLLAGDTANMPPFPCLPVLAHALTGEAQAAYLAVEGQPRCFDTVVAEEAATEARVAQLRQAGGLGDLPLIVLTRSPQAGGAPPAVEDVWQALQQELAGLSTRGTQVVAETSGHNIALDEPALVIEAIRQLAVGGG